MHSDVGALCDRPDPTAVSSPDRDNARATTVLLADGDAVTRLVLRRCLAQHWPRLSIHALADEAWAAFCDDQTCQIVILDWQQHLADGRPLLDAIRTASRSAYTYIIVMIKNPSRAEIHAAMESGADDVLAKPFFYEILDQRMLVAQRLLRLEARLLERQTELEAANARIQSSNEHTQRDLKAAADMQRSLLPDDLSGIRQAAVAWHYAPCSELGGDLIGCAPLDEHHLGFYVLDVSGHGVTAALLAVQVHRFLSVSSNDGLLWDDAGHPAAPSVVIGRLNTRFPMSARNQYFTILYGHLDLRTGAAVWCSAGHPWPVHVTAQGARQVVTRGSPAVGWLPTDRVRFFDHHLVLQPEESLLCFSDGVIEAMNGTGEQFGAPRLARLASGRRTTVGAALHTITTGLEAWIAGKDEQDDISLLLIRYTPGLA